MGRMEFVYAWLPPDDQAEREIGIRTEGACPYCGNGFRQCWDDGNDERRCAYCDRKLSQKPKHGNFR